MQSTQQLLLSVKKHLPAPNSLLPNQIMLSKPAQHIVPTAQHHNLSSGQEYIIDCQPPPLQKIMKTNAILENYYGSNNSMNTLLKHQDKIVFLHRSASIPNEQQFENEEEKFGSIQTQKSMHNQIILKSGGRRFHRKQSILHSLDFDDEIESGNLYLALRHDQYNYILANRFDYNTRSYGQWFCFKVRNPPHQNLKTSGYYTFNIVNMTKNGALFGKGLKVSVCRKGVWTKQGMNIHYTSNKFIRTEKRVKKLQKNSISQTQKSISVNSLPTRYFTLSFSVFLEEGQQIFLSYNQPYTYSKLTHFLDKQISAIELNTHDRKRVMKRTVICNSPLQNLIEMITISENKSILSEKKIIVIMARAHPIQTAGSFVVQGLIESLLCTQQTSEKDEEKERYQNLIDKLLQSYIFKIIPMINPDGVIVGNSRCNIFGFDLNRQWKQTHKLSPQIKAIKKAILKYEGKIQMIIDLHGHSKKKNVFAYGCHDFRAPFASREFPYLLSRIADKDFLFKECRFSRISDIQNTAKEGTARISLWNRLKIPNIFTIENSYCGSDFSRFHYDQNSYGLIGYDIVKALALYFQPIFQIQISQSFSYRKNSQLEEGEDTPIHQKQQTIKAIKEATLQRSLMLSDLRKNRSNIEIGFQSEESSQSEEEERINVTKEIDMRFRKKKKSQLKNQSRNKEIKQQKSRTEKNIKMESKSEKKTIDNIKESIISSHQKKNEIDSELLRSISETEVHRKKFYKYLEPLNRREEMKISKCEGIQQISPQVRLSKKSESQPIIKNPKNSGNRSKNVISVVEIGKESFDFTKKSQKVEKFKMNNSKEYSIQNRINQLNKMKKEGIKVGYSNRQHILEYSSSSNTNEAQWEPTLKPKKNIAISNSKFDSLLQKMNTINFSMKARRFKEQK